MQGRVLETFQKLSYKESLYTLKEVFLINHMSFTCPLHNVLGVKSYQNHIDLIKKSVIHLPIF